MKDRLLRYLGLLLLRVGTGVVFTIFGFDKLIHPFNWVGWVPIVVRKQVEATHLLTIFRFLKLQGVAEGVLGVLILVGVWTRLSALLCAAVLAGIVYFLGWDQIGIRDTGLLFSSLALSLLGAGEWSVDGGCGAKIRRRKR